MDEGERRWLDRADLRVIALRVALLALVAPLATAGYAALARQPWADRLAQRLTDVPLLSPPPWFWRLVLFMAFVLIVPVSLVERVALRWTPLTRTRALAGALLAGALVVPGGVLSLAQTQYVPEALAGRPDQGGADAFDAVRGVLAQPAREFLGAALALMGPFAVVTWCRLRAVRLRATWPATLALSAGLAAFALHVVAGLAPIEWLSWRTDFWTAVSAAVLLPGAFALVDRVDAWWAGSVPSGPSPVV